MKYAYLIMLVLVGLLVVAGCSVQQTTTSPTAQAEHEQITVAATFYPLYDLTKTIVGDKGTVFSLVPAGVEPHDYEPSPSDLQKLSDSDAFVTLGIEFEELEEDLIRAVNQNNIKDIKVKDIKVISASKGISLLKLEEEVDSEEDSEEHTGEDPHLWLSPKNAQKMAFTIMEGLMETDPDNGEYYGQTGPELIDDLKALDQEFKEGLAFCDKDVILVNHNAFSYLARDYGFRTIEISGLEPETEPTPRQLARLIEEAKEHDLHYVFYEELVDSRIARTIAAEVGAQTLELNPVEGTNDPSATYFSLMRKNLANLKIALECQ